MMDCWLKSALAIIVLLVCSLEEVYRRQQTCSRLRMRIGPVKHYLALPLAAVLVPRGPRHRSLLALCWLCRAPLQQLRPCDSLPRSQSNESLLE